MLLLDTEQLAPYAKLDDNQTQLSPGYGIYQCADERWIAVTAIGDGRLAALRTVLGADDDSGLTDAFARHPSDDLLAVLEAADIPAELVREDWEQGFFDQETDQPARIAVSYQHPEYGRFEQPGAFWNLGDLDLTLDLAPPLLGEQSTEILSTLGFNAGEIRALLNNGVVTVPTMPASTGA
jgi:crotonobetainyl-CoA:carnitine CoA-transferase CaiB-like acyl-CoA transferase